MTASVTSQFTVPPTPAQTGISLTKPTTWSGTFRGIAPPLKEIWLVYGRASAPPATYADLLWPQPFRLEECFSGRFTYTQSTNTNDGGFSVPGVQADGEASVGDLVYACIFRNASNPADLDAPLAVSAAIPVIA